MPTIDPVQNTAARAAIARAAERTGVDFDFLLAQARIESGLDPSAKAGTSSAAGLYQFVNSTWLETLDRHGARHGLAWASDAISEGGRVADAGTRAQLLSLRYDADTSSLMAAELTRDNAAGLRSYLGREPQPTELYLAHFLGLEGARNLLGANDRDPGQSAPALFPQAARANRTIFFDGDRPRSVGEVIRFVGAKVGNALGQSESIYGGTTEAAFRQAAGGHAYGVTPAPAVSSSNGGGGPTPQSRPSMAETIRATFGDGGAAGQAATRQVAAAYRSFKAFGL